MRKVHYLCCVVALSLFFLLIEFYPTGNTSRTDVANEQGAHLDEEKLILFNDNEGIGENEGDLNENLLDKKDADLIEKFIKCQHELALCKAEGRPSPPRPSSCWPPIPAHLAPLLSQRASCMTRPQEINYHNINCHNAGHFYTEDLPNIIFFNVTKICGDCLPTFQEAIRYFSPHVKFSDSPCYDDGSIHFNCFGPSICRIFPSRIFNLFGLEELKSVYNRIWNICGTRKINPDVDLVIINREGRRHITNIEILEEALKANQLSYLLINTSMVSNMSQCQIFNTWARGRIATGSYGADFTYPIILQKPTFPMMASSATEYFFEYLYATLRGPVMYSSPKFKVIPLAHYDFSQGNLDDFDSWAVKNFNFAPYTITEDAINQLLTFIRHLN